MHTLSAIRRPVEAELKAYKQLFDQALTHDDDFLGRALAYVRNRSGKMMRPILTLLTAKNLGEVGTDALRAAVTLELLHTASLVHDDVVDESNERRGQASVNAAYDNKVAVLVGDYLLSTSLLQAAETRSIEVVKIISRLGGTLSEGEVFQLAHTREKGWSEQVYFRIIEHKTAALFAACAELGALVAGGSPRYVAAARRLGQIIGVCFQIRDDIFDYHESNDIGKPTGNDMAEGKLTLPAIYALSSTGNARAAGLAEAVKQGTASAADIAELVAFTKQHGGIEYAARRMMQLKDEAYALLDAEWQNGEVREALKRYVDFTVGRDL